MVFYAVGVVDNVVDFDGLMALRAAEARDELEIIDCEDLGDGTFAVVYM